MSRRPLLLVLVLLLLLGVMPGSIEGLAQSAPEVLRVLLLDDVTPRTLQLTAESGRIDLYADDHGQAVATVAAGERLSIGRRGHEVHVVLDDLAFYTLELRVAAAPGASVTVDVLDGSREVKPRRYTGTLRVVVASNGQPALQLINEVDLSDYVTAVVAREYGLDEGEGAKAMAVLARTYALRSLERGDGAFDITDQVHAQKYDGEDRVTPGVREAVLATRGEVLTYGGDLVEAVYFSSSGGHTADNDAVWNGSPLPYLRGVPDPYDRASPHRDWRASVPRQELLRHLGDAVHARVDGFRIADRSRDGRVRTVALLDGTRVRQTMSGNDFRLLINRTYGTNTLRSTLFDARRDGTRYVFTGDGYGHGVGLSQWGAHEMARRGHSYRQILAYYFHGTELGRLNGTLPVARHDGLDPAPPIEPDPPTRKASSGRRVGW